MCVQDRIPSSRPMFLKECCWLGAVVWRESLCRLRTNLSAGGVMLLLWAALEHLLGHGGGSVLGKNVWAQILSPPKRHPKKTTAQAPTVGAQVVVFSWCPFFRHRCGATFSGRPETLCVVSIQTQSSSDMPLLQCVHKSCARPSQPEFWTFFCGTP